MGLNHREENIPASKAGAKTCPEKEVLTSGPHDTHMPCKLSFLPTHTFLRKKTHIWTQQAPKRRLKIGGKKNCLWLDMLSVDPGADFVGHSTYQHERGYYIRRHMQSKAFKTCPQQGTSDFGHSPHPGQTRITSMAFGTCEGLREVKHALSDL